MTGRGKCVYKTTISRDLYAVYMVDKYEPTAPWNEEFLWYLDRIANALEALVDKR